MEIDIEKIISGIVVELAKLSLEEIKDRIKKGNVHKKPKKHKSKKNSS